MKVTIAVVAMFSLASCERQSPHLEDTPRMSPSIRIEGLIGCGGLPHGCFAQPIGESMLAFALSGRLTAELQKAGVAK